MSKASQATNLANSHTTNIADLDLDGVPATHRHAVRALRNRLNARYDGIQIRRVSYTGSDTTVYLHVDDEQPELFGTFDLLQALDDTGVETAALRTGVHSSVKLDYSLGFEV